MKLNTSTTGLMLIGLLLQKGFSAPVNSANIKSLNISTNHTDNVSVLTI